MIKGTYTNFLDGLALAYEMEDRELLLMQAKNADYLYSVGKLDNDEYEMLKKKFVEVNKHILYGVSDSVLDMMEEAQIEGHFTETV